MKPMIEVTVLGKPRFPSPIRRPISDSLRLPEQILRDPQASPPAEELLFELAGPRAELFSIRSRRARALSPAADCAPVSTMSSARSSSNSIMPTE